MKTHWIAGIFVILIVSSTALAQAPNKKQPKSPNTSLYQAIQACKSQAEGNPCTIAGRGGSVKGTCSKTSNSDEMVCKPHPRLNNKTGLGGSANNSSEACKALTAGAVCSYRGINGKIRGICSKEKEGEDLICRPKAARGQKPGNEKMRATVIEACKSLKAGKACTFEGPRGPLNGICTKSRKDNALVCRPGNWREHKKENKGFMKGDKSPAAKAVEVCKSLSKGAACSFKASRGTVTGTCVMGHKKDTLVCLPTKELRGPTKERPRGPVKGK